MKKLRRASSEDFRGQVRNTWIEATLGLVLSDGKKLSEDDQNEQKFMIAHGRIHITGGMLHRHRLGGALVKSLKRPVETFVADDFTSYVHGTTNTWKSVNQRTGIVPPSGARETMIYNSDLRQHWKE